MPTVAVLAEPPEPGVVLPEIVETTPLSAADAADLYAAMLADVCEAVQEGAGDLLVNYRPADQVDADVDPQAAIETVLDADVPRAEDVRYEVQVGETRASRAGNTATHLLESEGVDSVVLTDPSAAFLRREHLGTVTMKLRTREAVVGPTSGGRVYLAGFREPVEFSDIYAPPAVQTVTARASDADLDVGFAPMLPVVRTAEDLVSAVALVRARVRAGRNVPPRFAPFVAEYGLRAVSEDEDLQLAVDEAGA
jgi:hypothetical protein